MRGNFDVFFCVAPVGRHSRGLVSTHFVFCPPFCRRNRCVVSTLFLLIVLAWWPPPLRAFNTCSCSSAPWSPKPLRSSNKSIVLAPPCVATAVAWCRYLAFFRIHPSPHLICSAASGLLAGRQNSSVAANCNPVLRLLRSPRLLLSFYALLVFARLPRSPQLFRGANPFLFTPPPSSRPVTRTLSCRHSRCVVMTHVLFSLPLVVA